MQLLIIVLKSISNIRKCYIILNTQPYTLYIYMFWLHCSLCDPSSPTSDCTPALSSESTESQQLDYQGVSAQLISTDVLTEKNMHRERIGKLGPMF